MNWVTETLARTWIHSCPIIFPTVEVRVTAYGSKQGTTVFLCHYLDGFPLFSFFFPLSFLVWGNFCCVAAGEISLANIFISWGMSVLLCPYCNVNIVSYTILAHEEKNKWIIGACSIILRSCCGHMVRLLFAVPSVWGTGVTGGDNTFVFGNATTHPWVSKTLSEICLRLCNPCQFCPHGCGTSRCAGGFLHSQVARERLLLSPLSLASCSQSNLVKIPRWLSAGLPQGVHVSLPRVGHQANAVTVGWGKI